MRALRKLWCDFIPEIHHDCFDVMQAPVKKVVCARDDDDGNILWP